MQTIAWPPARGRKKRNYHHHPFTNQERKDQIRSQKRGNTPPMSSWGLSKQKASKSNRLATESLVEKEARALSSSLLSWQSHFNFFFFFNFIFNSFHFSFSFLFFFFRSPQRSALLNICFFTTPFSTQLYHYCFY